MAGIGAAADKAECPEVQALPCSPAQAGPPENRLPGRPLCGGCLRPRRVCVCDHLPTGGPFDTETRIVLFVHPKEVKRPLGTAPILRVCLKNLIVLEADRFPEPEEDPELHERLRAGGHRVTLLCPGPDATVLEAATEESEEPVAPRSPALTLILVDGRWPQAKAMVNRSPWLQSIPRAVLRPKAPSGYVFRQQPEQGCLSTLEATAEALEALEGPQGPSAKAALLAPFRRMVELQCELIPDVRDKNANLGLDAAGADAPEEPDAGRPAELASDAKETGEGPVYCIVHWGAKKIDGREVLVKEYLRGGSLTEAKLHAQELSQGLTRGERYWVLTPGQVAAGRINGAPRAKAAAASKAA